MDAKKCDRCGMFFDIIPGMGDYSIEKRFGLVWRNLDLCPACMNEFAMFMKHTNEEKFGVE